MEDSKFHFVVKVANKLGQAGDAASFKVPRHQEGCIPARPGDVVQGCIKACDIRHAQDLADRAGLQMDAVYAIWSNGEIDEPTAAALAALFGDTPEAWLSLSSAFTAYRANEVAQRKQTQAGWMGRS